MKRKLYIKPDTYFISPDPFHKNLAGSDRVNFRVLSQILPYKYLVSGIFFSLPLFCIPLGTLFFTYRTTGASQTMMPILISSSLFFCFYTSLLGILLLHTRIPFLKEWKEKLGFTEV